MDLETYSKIHGDYEKQYFEYKAASDPRALKIMRKLYKYALSTGDHESIGYTCYRLAVDEYFDTGNYKAYLKYMRLAIKHLLSAKNRTEIYNIYYLISLDAMNKGMYDVAYHYSLHARDIAFEQGLEDEGMILEENAGYLLMQMGELEEAISVTGRALKYLVKHKKHGLYYQNVSVGYFNITAAWIGLKNIKKAEAAHKKVCRFVEDNPGKFIINTFCDIALNGARLSILKGDAEGMKTHTEELIRRIGEVPQIIDFIESVSELGHELINSGELGLAGRLLEKITEKGIPEDAVSMNRVLSEFKVSYYDAVGDRKKLMKVFIEQDRIWEQLNADRKRTNKYIEDLISLTEEIKKESERVHREREELMRMANTDALTGIPNRRALNVKLEEAFENAFRDGRSLGIAILDMDDLKKYNDTYGHAAGDRCIIRLGDALSEIAQNDGVFAARYGGDEFVVIYEGMTDEQIKTLAGSITGRCELEVSQGICNAVPKEKNRSWDFLACADRALYSVKRGRGRKSGSKIRFGKL